VAATNFDREATRGFALIQQRLESRHDGREHGRIWTAPSWGHSWHGSAGRGRRWQFQSTGTYRDHPVAGYGRRPGDASVMPGPAAAIELTPTEFNQLTPGSGRVRRRNVWRVERDSS
jgi:hypothetical protein